MPDQNQQQTQTQDPQNQGTVQNQDTNKDFDMFGGDSDIFESENLIPIDGEGEINKNDNNDFDDDINVDYRNEGNFSNTMDTPQTETTNNTNDLGDFDFSDAVNPTQSENEDTNNDLGSTNFEPTISTNNTEGTQLDDIGNDFGVYDEPDNPDDYVSPDEISDDITDLDDENTKENNIENENINTDYTNGEDTDDDFFNPGETETLEPIDENEADIQPIATEDTDEDDGISTTETEIENKKTEDIPNNEVEGNTDDEEDNDLLYSDIDDIDDIDDFDEDDVGNDSYSEKGEPSQINTTPDNTNYERNDDKTQIQNKFLELKFETEKIFQLVNKDYDVGFDILGANDDRQKIMYKLFIQDNSIDIQKNITDKSNNSEISHSLKFELDDTTLKTYIDDELLYDEITDLQNDSNKNKQVVEKLNKFIFLITEEYKKIIKDKKAKDHENIKKTTFREF